MRRRIPKRDTLVYKLDRILALVEQIARDSGISPKPPVEPEERPRPRPDRPDPGIPWVRGGYPGSEPTKLPSPPRTPGASVNPSPSDVPPDPWPDDKA